MRSVYDYKIVLYRQSDGSWAAYVPAIKGCYAIMNTAEEAIVEIQNVLEMIHEEYEEEGQPLPADVELVCARGKSARASESCQAAWICP